jgi:hypothetical protein
MTLIQSVQVDAEFNQIVEMLSGVSTTKNASIRFSDGSVPTLALTQLGAGPIATFSGPAGIVASLAVGGGFTATTLVLESANPTIEFRDNAGGTQPDYLWSLNAGVLNGAFLVSGNCNQAHDNTTNTSRFDALMDFTTKIRINTSVALGANNRLLVNHAAAASTDVASSLRGAAAIRPLDVVGFDNTGPDLARFFDSGDVAAARISKVIISAVGKISSRAVLSTSETADLIHHGGVIKTIITQASNAGTGESDLHSITLPARLFSANGDSIEFEVGLYFATTNSKTTRIYFGGSVLLTNINTVNDVHAVARGHIIRLDSDTVRSSITIQYAAANGATGTVSGNSGIFNIDSLDFTTSKIFKITGQGGAAANEVTVTTTVVKFWPANP